MLGVLPENRVALLAALDENPGRDAFCDEAQEKDAGGQDEQHVSPLCSQARV